MCIFFILILFWNLSKSFNILLFFLLPSYSFVAPFFVTKKVQGICSSKILSSRPSLLCAFCKCVNSICWLHPELEVSGLYNFLSQIKSSLSFDDGHYDDDAHHNKGSDPSPKRMSFRKSSKRGGGHFRSKKSYCKISFILGIFLMRKLIRFGERRLPWGWK